MNWEYIYEKLCEEAINHRSPLANMVYSVLNKELNDKIIIKKGENRHPYADVYHEAVEGKEWQWSEDGVNWYDVTPPRYQYRIKLSEPVYEYKYFVGVIYGIDTITEGY